METLVRLIEKGNCVLGPNEWRTRYDLKPAAETRYEYSAETSRGTTTRVGILPNPVIVCISDAAARRSLTSWPKYDRER
jgi:hypothetical protein